MRTTSKLATCTVTCTRGAPHVQNDYKQHDDHARVDDCDAPVAVRNHVTASEGVQDAHVVPYNVTAPHPST